MRRDKTSFSFMIIVTMEVHHLRCSRMLVSYTREKVAMKSFKIIDTA
ncbi:hypothetical protein J3S90_13205 [Flavobacterium sp. P4023]|uniref:Uncharacterized protein n=1 Tax=Flavobacterium flabelliforme TaxID=2816119 RepID=A0ABS5CVV6_9FLAO|nr:hypothetical protein [Flavobacterium flabelliforme]MBP4142758.1 hypothetical protein [Flavobacterium flabelliforme]